MNFNINDIIKYNDSEMNSLSYIKPLKIDKRTYIQFYFSLLKTKQAIIFIFCSDDDYNLRSIKILLFLFSFALDYVINALFFDDSTMHKIYEDEGKFHFIYQIPNKIKIIIFFILTFIFLPIFWYYVSCFCVVYKNTQIYLIKDTLITGGLHLLYPFVLCLIPGIIRIPSLRARERNKMCLANIN